MNSNPTVITEDSRNQISSVRPKIMHFDCLVMVSLVRLFEAAVKDKTRPKGLALYVNNFWFPIVETEIVDGIPDCFLLGTLPGDKVFESLQRLSDHELIEFQKYEIPDERYCRYNVRFIYGIVY